MCESLQDQSAFLPVISLSQTLFKMRNIVIRVKISWKCGVTSTLFEWTLLGQVKPQIGLKMQTQTLMSNPSGP